MSGRFVRMAEQHRPAVTIVIDGRSYSAMQGDTLLVAVLSHVSTLRQSEFGDGARAGFCLMGACQDCWMWTPEGERLRACTTEVISGMQVLTQAPTEDAWPNCG